MEVHVLELFIIDWSTEKRCVNWQLFYMEAVQALVDVICFIVWP